MAEITIPVDPYSVAVQYTQTDIQTRHIQVGGATQSRSQRVSTTEDIESGWHDANLGTAMLEANRIWARAQIRFCATRVAERREALPGNASQITAAAFQYLVNLVPVRPGRITLLLVREFQRADLGGQASRGACILPSTLAVHLRGRILAHEFGHLLELGHVVEGSTRLTNLMRPGLVAGPDLEADQISRARGSALAVRAASVL